MASRATDRRHLLALRIRIVRVSFGQDMLGRRAAGMTIQAPSHAERRMLANASHLFHVSMAGLAGDAFGDVAIVRKTHEVRKLMHSHPLDGFPGAMCFMDLLDLLAAGLHDR